MRVRNLIILMIIGTCFIQSTYADTLSDLLNQYGTPIEIEENTVGNTQPEATEPIEHFVNPIESSNNEIQDIPFEENTYEDIYSAKDKESIQFTCEKNSLYPLFIDTGLKENMLREEDVNVIITQIVNSSKNNKVIQGENASLVLVSGQLASINNTPYTITEINQAFSNTDVLFTYKQSKQNNQFALSDYLETHKDFKFIINNQEIALDKKPFIENNRVLFPIREIAEGLGASVKWDHQTGIVTIKKDQHTFILKENSAILTIIDEQGERRIDTGAIPRIISINGEERLFAYIEDIVTELNHEIYWDAIKLAVVLE